MIPEQSETGAYLLVAKLREALGDPQGRLMQDELIERAKEARQALAALEATCAWAEDEDGCWHTECGHELYMMAVYPFCCFCGAKRSEKPFEP